MPWHPGGPGDASAGSRSCSFADLPKKFLPQRRWQQPEKPNVPHTMSVSFGVVAKAISRLNYATTFTIKNGNEITMQYRIETASEADAQ